MKQHSFYGCLNVARVVSVEINPMKAFILALTLASASAFAPCPTSHNSVNYQTVLHATSSPSNTSRRQLLQNTLSVVSSACFLGTTPTIANAADTTAYVTSIEQSTNALSQSLGHALLVIDGLNAQAKRLGSSPHPAHPIAVLDGMNAQAKRLTRDLDTSLSVLDTIKSQAKEITIADEKFDLIVGNVAHASSVLDGMVTQSKRLENASVAYSGGSVANTDDQIIYMLSVLDGLNAQVRRLDEEQTFGVLDEINAKAARALL